MPALDTRTTGLNIAAFLCALVSLAVFYNSLQCGLVFDDESAIKNNKDLRPELRSWWDLLKHDFWGATLTHKDSHKSYRPLTVATFRLNYMLHELEPLGYHLVNVLLHGGVCYLYVLLCGVVFSEVWPALIAGLLFAVHPIHTEAVASVVGRAETLSANFFLFAFFAFRKSAFHSRGKTRWQWIAVCLVCTGCSVVSKEQGLTVMAVCVLFDFFCLQKLDLKTLSKTLPHSIPASFIKRTAVLALFTVITMVMRFWVMGGAPKVFDKQINPPVALATPYRQLSWLYLTFVNSWLLLNPYNLCADWRFGTAPVINSLIDPLNILTLLTLSVVVYGGLYSVSGSTRRHKVTVLALSLLILPYLPASNLFFPVGFVVAERVLYLPSMGFCMLVAFGASRILKKSFNHSSFLRGGVTLSIIAVLSIHSLKTVTRNLDWASDYSIYASAVRINPNHGPMLTNLGAVYVMDKELKNYTTAEMLFKRCVDVLPEYPRGLSNYAGLLQVTRRKPQAEKMMRQAIEMGLRHTAMNQLENIYSLLRMIQKDREREEDALELCDFALRHYPSTAYLFFHRGKILTAMNRTREAIHDLEIAVQTPVFLADINHHLGLAYVAAGLLGKAERAFRTELAGNPGGVETAMQLGMVLAVSGVGDNSRLREGLKLLHQVLAVRPTDTEALYHLAHTYQHLQNLQKSEETYLHLLRLSPTHSDARYQLGHVYYKTQNYRKAIETWQKLDSDYKDVAAQLKLAKKHSK